MTAAAKPESTRLQGPSLRAVLVSAAPALLLATVCLLPSLNKPFLIDDPHFLRMAEQILKHPIHPMDFRICWNMGPGICTKAYLLTPGNALMGYALVPTVLAGASESVAHLTQLVFIWIALITMSSLVMRLGWDRGYAMAATLLLVAIPPLLPMASTAFPDVLAGTLALLSMERLAAWRSEGKWPQAAVAAVALGLAGFARAHLVLLLPLGAFFLLEDINPRQIHVQVRRRPWRWTPILMGATILAALIFMTRERNLMLDPPSVYTGTPNILPNLRSYLLYFAFPLPLVFCWSANQWKTAPRRLVFLLMWTVSATCWVWVTRPNRATILERILALIALGVLANLVWESWRKRDHLGLSLLLWLFIPLPIAYYLHLPIKYLLPCMPAVILICLRMSVAFSARAVRVAGICLILAGVIYSLLILRSDAEFAKFGRDSMYHLVRPHVAAGETVWFPLHFSAYWYAEKTGAILADPSGQGPGPGDLLVVGLYEGGQNTLRRFPNRTLVESVSHHYSFGRTMGPRIGLYTNRFWFGVGGNWLWGFGDSPLDRYELWRIQ